MYSVVEIQGHQYQVNPGQVIDVEKLKSEEGQSLDFDQVLFVGGETPLVGMPVVSGAKVTCKVIHHGKGRKILMMKRRPRKWRKSKGHRQHYTALLVTSIEDGKGNKLEIDPKSKNAEKYLK